MKHLKEYIDFDDFEWEEEEKEEPKTCMGFTVGDNVYHKYFKQGIITGFSDINYILAMDKSMCKMCKNLFKTTTEGTWKCRESCNFSVTTVIHIKFDNRKGVIFSFNLKNQIEKKTLYPVEG